MSVCNNTENQKNSVNYNIECSKFYWYQFVKTSHKGLERIYAKSCDLKYSNAYRKQDEMSQVPEWLSEAVNGVLTVDNYVSDFDEAEEIMKTQWASRNRNNPEVWHTTHTSIYDTESIASQENYDSYFEFTF